MWSASVSFFKQLPTQGLTASDYEDILRVAMVRVHESGENAIKASHFCSLRLIAGGRYSNFRKRMPGKCYGLL